MYEKIIYYLDNKLKFNRISNYIENDIICKKLINDILNILL